ncbi:adenosine deaminase [Acidithiobacillus sp. IBUN Pt1247-S3]|uniref:adenosine deaminase n=1 Tax=Acidithiobacillus sp. IBUN Pt1247-S3 TaxID=3166642 RepID=UPI0034E46336
MNTLEKKKLAEMPKIELHLHIEGSLEPEMLLSLAEKNQISLPYNDVDAVRAAYRFRDLQSFLNLYYLATQCLKTEQDFYALTLAYLRHCRDENIVYTEMFFDPQTHLEHGVPLAVSMAGIAAAQGEAEREWGVDSALILCFERDRPAEGTIALLKDAEKIGGIIGVGLDSAERNHPPAKFAATFAAARALGLHRVAHAGEEGPPEYILEALDKLGVERIDHGVRALESPELVERLRAEQIPLTVCPFSNVALGGFGNLQQHNVARLLESGLKVTINSDDPAYFGGYLTANISDTWDALGLSFEQTIQVQKNAIDGCFAQAHKKREMYEKLSVYG